MSTSGGVDGGGGAVLVAQLQIDAGSIAELNGSPVELVPAPGAGLAVRLVAVTAEYVAGDDGWLLSDTWGLYYADADGPPLTIGSEEFLISPGLTVVGDLQVATVNVLGAVVVADADNAPVVVSTEDDDPTPTGPIVAVEVDDGGALYAPGDTGAILNAAPSDNTATYEVDTVDGGGAVLTFHVVDVGASYTTGAGDNPKDTVTGGAQPGIGTGLTVNVTEIPPADGTLLITALYHVVQVA